MPSWNLKRKRLLTRLKRELLGKADNELLATFYQPFSPTHTAHLRASVPVAHLLDVVPGTGVIGDVQHTGESIQAVAHCNVYGLPKDAIATLRVGNHLQVDVRQDG